MTMRVGKPLLLFYLGLALLSAGCARHHGMGYSGGGRGDAVERGAVEMKALVESTVQDPEKAKRVQAIVEEIMNEVKQLYQQDREFHRRLYELNANFEATPEQFTKILDDLNNNRMRVSMKILGKRFQMKEMLSSQEWKALSEGMEKARSRYRHGREMEGGKSGT
jgi:uncharacterized coiled-coil DUF342 family protein